MNICLNSHTRVSAAPGHLAHQVKAQLTFLNPKWIKNQRMDRWQGDTQREIKCYEHDAGGGLIAAGRMRSVAVEFLDTGQRDIVSGRALQRCEANKGCACLECRCSSPAGGTCQCRS